MAKFRKAAGYYQRDLARKTGISQRGIAYYEKQSKYPPTHLLPVLADAMGIYADILLGIKKTSNGKKRMRVSGGGLHRLKRWIQNKNARYCKFWIRLGKWKKLIYRNCATIFGHIQGVSTGA